MKLEFADLILEFETIFEAANNQDDLPSRRILLAEASMTLAKARNIWQDEMRMLRSRAEILRDARVTLAESRGVRNAAPFVSRSAPPPHP